MRATLLERLGLGARLALLGVGATLLVTGVGGWVLRESVHDTVLRGIEQGLNLRAERIIAHLGTDQDGGIIENRSRVSDEFNQIFSGWYWQLSELPARRDPSASAATSTAASASAPSTGRELRSRSLWDSRLDAGAAVPIKAGSALLRLSGPRGEPVVGLVRDVQVGERAARLHVFGTAMETDDELDHLDRVLLITQLVLLAVLLLVTVVQVRWGLRPLRRLHAALSAVRSGEAERIAEPANAAHAGHYGPDLAPLVEEIDEVLSRNAQVVARARHHAADLSHALKKPLALLGAEAGASQVRGELVQAEVAAMSRLIDRHLARAGSGAGEMRRIDARERLDSLVTLMRRLHAERSLDWAMDAPAALPWRGEPTDLEEMLGNLLDNAGKWAASRVRLVARIELEHLCVVIEDDGPGIAEDEIGEAMRRGRRFDEATEGSGLGLAIARDIAETYGGRLTLGRSPMGGLEATLRLPA